MARRAFINWQKFVEETELENRKEYMVCIPGSDNDDALLEHATYYDKGTVVNIHMDEDKMPAGMESSPEERLLKALFGATKPFVIPEDGFYLLTGDYGVNEEQNNGAFLGCREQPICRGNRQGWRLEKDSLPVYWAEIPILPDGLKLAGQETATNKARKKASEAEESQYAELMDQIASDPVTQAAYKSLCGEAMPGDAAFEKMIGQAVYAVTPHQIALTIIYTWDMCKAICGVPEEEFLGIRAKLQNVKASEMEKAQADLAAFCKERNIPAPLRMLMFRYTEYLAEDCKDFYYYRNKLLSANNLYSLNMLAVLQESWAKSTLPFRVGRLVKLMRIGAPEIILINELRILVERILASKNGDRIICVGPDFDAMYGVYPDGSRGERHCEFGDKELFLLPEEPDPEEETEEDASEEMEVPEEEDDAEKEPEPVLGVDYPWFAVVLAPNFLMRKCLFVLWDNQNGTYLRDENGEIEQFDDWNSAKARSEELSLAAERAKAESKTEE